MPGPGVLVERNAAWERREAAWSSGDLDTFVQADTAFHRTVIAAAHNPALTGLYADLRELLLIQLRDHFMGAELTPDLHMDHAGLVAAIKNGDAVAATREAAGYFTDP